jgi:hypothetical protein
MTGSRGCRRCAYPGCPAVDHTSPRSLTAMSDSTSMPR